MVRNKNFTAKLKHICKLFNFEWGCEHALKCKTAKDIDRRL